MANDKRDEILEAARIWLNRNCPSRLIKEYDASRLADFAIAYAAATAEGIPQADGWVAIETLPDEDDLPDHFDVTLWNADEPDYYEVVDVWLDVDGRWIMGDEMDVTESVIAWRKKPAPYQRQSSEGE